MAGAVIAVFAAIALAGPSVARDPAPHAIPAASAADARARARAEALAARTTPTGEPRILADYDTVLPGWRIRGGRYTLAIARHAQDRTLVRTADMIASTITIKEERT